MIFLHLISVFLCEKEFFRKLLSFFIKIFVMKLLSVILLLFLGFNVFAQKADEILATANNQNFTAAVLPQKAREDFESLSKKVAETRAALLEQQIAAILLESEASARKTTVEKLVGKEVRTKTPNPTQAQIQAVYEANRAAIGDKTLEEVRPQIVDFLRRESEQKASANFVSTLKTKYKSVSGKDVNTPNLKLSDVLATVGGRQITAKDFEDKNKPALFEFEIAIYDQVRSLLEYAVYSNLLAVEAKAQGIASNDLIAREISDKNRSFSIVESDRLQYALQQRLFQKYNAKFFLKEPLPIVQNISTDDDPAQGRADAPVTVVMFSDLQCPACSAVHPVLKKAMAEYGDKIRFVVRDFPLVNNHENAFNAALAANAANAQNKFFEYIEILYQNQDKLDVESLKKYALDLGLDQKRFDADFADKKFATEVGKDMKDGKDYGVGATPTIFVNGIKVRTLSYESFRNSIEQALKK